MRVGRAAGWLALLLAATAAALAALPLEPTFLEATLDNGFAAVLNHTAAQPLAARPRLISTYGPLGFTHGNLYLPDTYPWTVALRAPLAAALCGAIGWLGWAAWRSPWGGALALALAAPLLRGGDLRLFTLVAMVPLIELAERPPPRLLRLGLGVMIGVAALTKVTFLTAAAVVLGPLTLASLIGGRGLPPTALAAAVTALAGWPLLGLGVSDAVAYLDWSARDITPGYSQAMQMRTTPALVYHAAAVSLALLIWVTGLAWRRRRAGWWAVPLAVAPLLLLQFKAGFVRADVHVFATAFALLLQGGLLALLLGRRPPAVAAGLALLLALPGALLWHALIANGRPTSSYRFVSAADLIQRLQTVPAMLGGTAFDAPHAAAVRDLRDPAPLPAFDGGVDMFGLGQSLLIGQAADYRPRPVFQSYMAYTPRLARENAAYLAGAAAPRWILFDTATIDGRLPAMDDAAAWPELLTRYRPVGAIDRFALLERRSVPRPWRLVPISAVATVSDQRIAVPPTAGAPVWARIDVQETTVDRLQTLVVAAPYVYLDVVLTTDAVWRARLVAAVARDGFLLSPVVNTTAGFVALAENGAGALAEKEVRAIVIHVDDPLAGSAGPRQVRVEFFRLEIDR
jgi:hypothetical protein